MIKISKSKSPEYKKKHRDYLKSDAWEKKRGETFFYHGDKCEICFEGDWRDGKDINIHHATYKNIGQENCLTELVVLCRQCHDKIHKLRRTDLHFSGDMSRGDCCSLCSGKFVEKNGVIHKAPHRELRICYFCKPILEKT